MIDQSVSLTRLLNLFVSAFIPLMRMAHHAGTYHVQIHVDQALDEMLVGLLSRCLIAILPKGPFAFLPRVVFLTRSSRNELHGSRDDFPLIPIKELSGGVPKDYRIKQHTRSRRPLQRWVGLSSVEMVESSSRNVGFRYLVYNKALSFAV